MWLKMTSSFRWIPWDLEHLLIPRDSGRSSVFHASQLFVDFSKEWEKYLKHIKLAKDWYLEYTKNSYKSVRIRQFNQKNKWAKNMNMQTPEDIQITSEYIKAYWNPLVIREYRKSSYKPVRNRQHIGKKVTKNIDKNFMEETQITNQHMNRYLTPLLIKKTTDTIFHP